MLLWLMQLMVINDDNQTMTKSSRPVMEFVRLKQKSETLLKQREKPEEPPPPETPPPQAPEMELTVVQPMVRAPNIAVAMPALAASSMTNFDGPYIGAVSQGPPDRDFMALSRIPPRYPYRAERKKIEGWVKISFTITEQGTVQDAVVIDAKPEDIFDKAALQAILKWKFKPRISDGKPVATRADQTIKFGLNKRRR